MNSVYIYICMLVFCLAACKSNPSYIEIKGHINNLEDGKIKLIGLMGKTIEIDSTIINNGKFVFKINSKIYCEPTVVKILHYDLNNNVTIITYKTKKKIKNKPNNVDIFMLENGVNINGTLTGIMPLNPKTRLGYIDSYIQTGRQTQVMYNDTFSFSTITKISKIKELIKQHSYSYYYLYELKNRVSSFTNDQFLSLLSHFDEDVQESKTGKELREYIENRNTKKLDFTTTLVDRESKKKVLLEKKAALNMVILWASWCGPCRKEIPQLKKVYAQFTGNSQFNMVSVSLDDSKENWYKALDKEQMPWKQLIITPEASTYSKELFSFDGSIPTTLFVDNEGQIVKKFVGYDEKSLEEFTALIEQYTVFKKKNE